MSARWVRPSWFALLLTAAGVVVFSGLGWWQLGRAHEKERLLAAYAGAASAPPQALAEARRNAARDDGPHAHVHVRGRYDARHEFVLDDQVRDGRQGVLVYTLFEPVDGSMPLLVGRGFVTRDAHGALPVVPPASDAEQALSGLYAPAPGGGLRLGGNPLPAQRDWPKRGIYLDPSEIGADLGRTIDPRVLLLDPDPASGFMREWTPQILPPSRHRGYAFQWFSFAVAAVVILIAVHRRRARKESE